MKKLTTVFGIILTALSALLTAGVKTVFCACDHKSESGMWMSCHWAEQALFAIGIALCCASLMTVIIRSGKVRAGLALGMIPAAVSAMLIPNVLINLCMKTDMRCHTVMRPAVMLICGVIAVCAGITAFSGLKSKEKA